MSAFKELLGDCLLSDAGIVPIDVLEGKTVGLYFSAHWCPPCRSFTPELAKAFKELRASKNWEICFISSDKEETAFKEYFAEMPWFALPFADRARKQKLSSRFKVSGIPSLIILDSNAKLITLSGRHEVSNDPKGVKFPWPKLSALDLLPRKLFNNKGVEVSSLETVRDLDVLAFYFSAHWCGPCRSFTPQLVSFYNKLKEDGKKFEVIFVSADKDDKAFTSYFQEMPWLAIDFADDEKKDAFNQLFEVDGIPTLVLIDPKTCEPGPDGRSIVLGDPQGLRFPWWLNQLSVSGPLLNESPCLVALLDGLDDTAQKEAVAIMDTVSKRLHGRKNPEGNGLHFMFGDSSDADIITRIRAFTNVSRANVLLLDLPSQKRRTAIVQPFSLDAVARMAEDFLSGQELQENFNASEV